MIRYICENCEHAFDEPIAKTSEAYIDGRRITDMEDLCPLCGFYYFHPADYCSCGNPKRKSNKVCIRCKAELLKRIDDFFGELTCEEEQQFDDWMEGDTIQNRKKWK